MRSHAGTMRSHAATIALAIALAVAAIGCSNVANLQKKHEAGDERALLKLIEIVSRPDYPYGTRRNAARALGEIGRPAAVPALIAALQTYDRRTTLKQEAAIALGKIGDPSAIEAIGRLMDRSLGDENAELRMAILPVIGQLGGPRAAEYLVRALGYYDYLTLQNERKNPRGIFTGEENPWYTPGDSLRYPAQIFDDPQLGGGLGGFGGQGSPIGMFGTEFGSQGQQRPNPTPEERRLAHDSLVAVGEDAIAVIETQIKSKPTTVTLKEELLGIVEEIRSNESLAPAGELTP